MNQIPKIQLGQQIHVSNNGAIVSKIYPDKLNRNKTVEIVYLLDGAKPMYEDAHWIDGEWRFVSDGQVSGYADGIPRLRKYVEVLQASRRKSPLPKKGRHQLVSKPRPRSLGGRR